MDPKYSNAGMKARLEILETSLIVEGYIAELLAELLGVNSRLESKTLGNTSSSLSFNTKIDLLIDIGALSGDKKRMFQIFMEIRNQFVHNFLANTYVALYEQMDNSKKNFILKHFPQSEFLSNEQQLEYATRDLTLEIMNCIDEVKNAVINKRIQEIYRNHFEVSMEAFGKSVDKMEEYINKQMSSMEWGPEEFQKRMNNIGTTCSNLINKYWKEEMDNYYKQYDIN